MPKPLLMASLIFLGACSPAPREYAVEGTLGVVFVQSPGAFPFRYLLDTGETNYELRFSDSSEFVNIESTPSGEKWYAGGWYGVDGRFDGETIDVTAIEYLGAAPKNEIRPPEESPAVFVSPPAVPVIMRPPEDPLAEERSWLQGKLRYFRKDCEDIDLLISKLNDSIAHTERGLSDDAGDSAAGNIGGSGASSNLKVRLDELQSLRIDRSRCQEKIKELENELESLDE